MARKLPWATSPNATTSSPPKRASSDARPMKRAKTKHTDEHGTINDDSTSHSPGSTKQNSTKPSTRVRGHVRTRDVRSPSTSPVPPPSAPPPVNLMRPGLDQDDIYMMVEDEFQEIAQSYTQHIHRAELERRTREIRERKAEQERAGIGILGDNKIPDNLTAETRQRLKSGLLREKQSSGLKSMLGNGLKGDSGDDDSEEEKARAAELTQDGKEVPDIWAGTALGGLMNRNHSQEKMSLKGLERIGGETRASKGYGPSGRTEGSMSKDGDGNRRSMSRFTNDADSIRRVRAGQNEKSALQSTTNGTRNERLGSRSAAPYAKSVVRSDIQKEAALLAKDEPRTVKTERESTKSVSSRRIRYRNFVDSLDDFDEEKFKAS